MIINLKINSCIICNKYGFESLVSHGRDTKKHSVVKCKNCFHIQLSPIPTIDDEEKFYNRNLQQKNIHDVVSIKQLERKMNVDTERRVKFVSKLTSKKGRILEIGSGHGFFLEKMRKNGYDITGIEVSKEKQKILKKVTKAKIISTNINENTPEIGVFDTIVFFHVLEHMREPIDFVNKCRNMLKRKGKIIAEVPNYNDFQLKLNNKYREFFWQRAHISYFSPKILKKVFQKNDFNDIEITGVQRYSIENLFSWKLTNKPQIENPIYNLDKNYNWIESFYKEKLEKSLKCDTIMIVAKKNEIQNLH